MSELTGKLAIVTGGTGALGGAVVVALQAAGATVFVPYTRPDEFAALHQRPGIGEKLGGMQLDLTNEAAVAEAYAQIAGLHGGLHALVNVAGGFAGGQTVAETAWAVWQQQLDTNLKTAVLSCKAALPLLGAGGAIVNIGTRTVTQPGAHVAAYGASKRAVIGLTEALAAELLGREITCNALLPGVIDTPANRKNEPDADHSRWVAPAAIAAVVRFLVGPDARIISGASIPVYGRS